MSLRLLIDRVLPDGETTAGVAAGSLVRSITTRRVERSHEMKLLHVWGPVPLFAAGGIACGDLLTLIDQERRIYARAWIADIHILEEDEEEALAPGFDVFLVGDDAVNSSPYRHATQGSIVASSHMSGTRYATGFGIWNGAHQPDHYGRGDAEDPVTFEVVDPVWVHLSGRVRIDNGEYGGSDYASVTLHDGGVLMLEQIVEQPVPDFLELAFQHAMWLDPGTYVIETIAHWFSVGSNAPFVARTVQTWFEFEATFAADEPCDGDVALPGGDGVVDTQDLLFVFAEWGGNESDADIDPGPGGGIAGVLDVLALLE